jgi:hypothetical protein
LSISQFIVLIPFFGFEFFGLPMSGNIHNLVDIYSILYIFSCTYVKQLLDISSGGHLTQWNFSLSKDREF